MKIPRTILTIIILCSMVNVHADEKITVVCTTTLLETLTEEIGGEYVEATSLVQPGICPAFFDIKPSDVYEVSNASLILYSGIEPWLDDLVQSSGNTSVRKVLLQGEWNTPERAAQIVAEIAAVLAEVDPHHASQYETNAKSIIDELECTGETIQQRAGSLDIVNTEVICMQWQVPFVEWVGFDVIATYGPPGGLSMKDIAKIINDGKDATLVIDNLQSGTKIGSQIASEIGANHVILTNFPNAIPGTETISSMIEYNAEQLFNAAKAYNVEDEREKRSYALEIILLTVIFGFIVAVIYFKRK